MQHKFIYLVQGSDASSSLHQPQYDGVKAMLRLFGRVGRLVVLAPVLGLETYLTDLHRLVQG